MCGYEFFKCDTIRFNVGTEKRDGIIAFSQTLPIKI